MKSNYTQCSNNVAPGTLSGTVNSRCPRRRRKVVGALLLALVCQAAQAVLSASGSGPVLYQIDDVPDFDQNRAGLPGGGEMYCYPTASMNWLAWLASNQGLDVLSFKPPAGWASPSVYNDVTAEIDALGVAMQTDAKGGTGGNNAMYGLRQWFSDHGIGKYSAYNHYGYTEPGQLADQASLGGLVSMAMGFYKKTVGTGPEFDAGPVYTRTGGHLVSMTSLTILPRYSVNVIGVHDPDRDEGDNQAQSAFATEQYDLVESTGTFREGKFEHVQPLYRVDSYTTKSSHAYMDGYLVIRPALMLSAGAGPFSGGLPDALHLVQAWEPGSPARAIDVPEGVIDAALSPSGLAAVYLAAATATQPAYLGGVNLVDDRHTHLANVPGALSLTTGRFDEAFTLYRNGRRIMKSTLSGQPANTSAFLPFRVQSIRYSDNGDFIIGLASDRRSLVVLDRDLNVVNILALPEAVEPTGESLLAISPVSGNLFVVTPQTAGIHELGFEMTDQLFPVAIAPVTDTFEADLALATGISINDLDHVFISTSTGAGMEFARTPDGDWGRVSDEIDNMYLTKLYQVSASRSNRPQGDTESP